MSQGGGRPRVWAPHAGTVELHMGSGNVRMERRDDGWWTLDVRLPHGERYGFVLDGGPVRPDPRSPWQPDGVDGLSAVVDHGAFAWSDAGWRGLPLAGAVLYELHVGTFSAAGTFQGAIEHLPRLVDLGVDAVELMPVGEFSGARGWGYDGVDLFAPHHAYGGPDGLKSLVDACHAAGLGVVLDVVYNHLGPAGNYLPEFGPYLSSRHTTGWGAGLNFDDCGSDEVRRFVVDNALMWLRDYHVDGLRLDAVHAIVDLSVRHVLAEIAAEVEALTARSGRVKFLVAESDLNDPRAVRSREAGGWGLASAWADEWHHALHAALTGERAGYYEDFGSLTALAKALRQAWVSDGGWSRHRRRTFGGTPAGLPGDRFVVSTQNHDQIGNRAAGERTAALVNGGRLRVAAALLLTSPFVPMLFQGEEWGATTPFLFFTDHADAELGRTVTSGRRAELAAFGWDAAAFADPQAPATFAASKLDRTEVAGPEHASLLAWYRELIALRRREPVLADPRWERVAVVPDEAAGTLVIERGEGVRVLVNLGDREAGFAIVGEPAGLLAQSARAVRLGEDGVVVPPDAVAIVKENSG